MKTTKDRVNDWRKKNRDKYNAYMREWRLKNKEHYNAYQRERYAENKPKSENKPS
jgi:hypothetical protein